MRNPAKAITINKQQVNISRILETLKSNTLKRTIANMDYTQAMKRDWKDIDTGGRRAV